MLVTSKDEASYSGVGFYAPDMVDGELKYTAVFVYKAMFGQPSMSLQTKGDNIQFNTPTTSGEFMDAWDGNHKLLEAAVCDTEAQAQGWIDAIFAAGA